MVDCGAQARIAAGTTAHTTVVEAVDRQSDRDDCPAGVQLVCQLISALVDVTADKVEESSHVEDTGLSRETAALMVRGMCIRGPVAAGLQAAKSAAEGMGVRSRRRRGAPDLAVGHTWLRACPAACGLGDGCCSLVGG